MSAPTRPEPWAILAYAVAALFGLLLLYLGLRPGGVGPVFAYGAGRHVVELLALATLLLGGVWSLVRRPVLQRRRAVPFLLLVLVIGVVAYPIPYPSSHEGHESAVRFRLPFEGEWTVVWGGETKEENLLAAYSADRRWGLDLVVARDGRTHAGEGHFCVGQAVLAPADGVVREGDPQGDRVVIEVAPREFVFLSGLEPGSVRVRGGDSVKAGDLVGRVGAAGGSAATPEPHLAIHLQDTPEPRRGEAIPWSFRDYLADGVPVARGLPRGGVGPGGRLVGQKVQPAASAGR